MRPYGSAKLLDKRRRKAMELLGEGWIRRRKAVRFHFINLPARVTSRARRLKVRLRRGHPSLDDLIRARALIAALAPVRTGRVMKISGVSASHPRPSCKNC